MFRRLAALTLVCVGTAALATAGPATAATATDLYVDQSKPLCRDDPGAGTQDLPFCTIQAAADVALPGQTVHVAVGSYAGATITRSGAPGAPISFVGVAEPHRDLPGGNSMVGYTVAGGPTPHSFTVSGAHDVVISTFTLQGAAGAVVVDNSSHVTVDSNEIVDSGAQSASSGVSLTGGSSAITVSRNYLSQWGTAGISVGQGVTATITTNAIMSNYGPAVVVTDAPGTVVTSNTVGANCVAGIVLGGTSPGSTVENNVLYADDKTVTGKPNCKTHTSTDTGEIAVAAASTDRTVVDYNLVYTTGLNYLYSWRGIGFMTAADLTSFSGQGRHDLNTDPKFSHTFSLALTEGSPAIDSADPTAPGELSTDLMHGARADDPLVANAGTGFVDRGASEFEDPFQLNYPDVTPSQGPFPLPVTITAKIDNPWSTPVSYSFEFGDGSAPVTSGSPVVQHTYERGSDSQGYDVGVSVTLPTGVTRHIDRYVLVTAPAPTVAKLSARQIGPLTVIAEATNSTSPWAITEYDFDYGDGSPVVKGGNPNGDHKYAAPITYTITLTIHDGGGHTATATQQITVGDAYYAAGPQRLLDTRDGGGPLGVGGEKHLQMTGANGVPASGVTAVVLNVTATDTTAASFLSIYPTGSPHPGTSNLNFRAGQTVPNLVTVPVGPDGKIVITNFVGAVDVVVDLEGYYLTGPAQEGGGFLDTAQPHRVMDTRDGTGGVPRAPIRGIQSLDVGTAAPQNVSAVVLNVTVTNPTTDSFLTVYPDGAELPPASNLNYRAGQTTSNLVIVPVLNGKVDFVNHFGSADVIADVQGYFVIWPTGSVPTTGFAPVAPSRLLDTRDHATPVGSNSTIGLPVAGVATVPAYAKAVVLNVTVVNPTANSFLTVFPGGGVRPATSNLNFGPGQITQGQVIVPIGPDGKIDFFNLAGTVDVVADVFGYFA